MKTIDISFLTSGRILQEIKFLNNIDISKEEFVSRLNSGRYITTIQRESSNVLDTEDNFNAVATISHTESVDCEYEDFELED